MNKTLLVTGAILAGSAVILGAFGAHGLKNALTPESLNSFETGVRYQMYHALLLLFLGVLPVLDSSQKQPLYWLIVSGLILFSGSIYLLSTQAVTGIDIRRFGWVTPIGGALLIVSWGILAFQLIRAKF